MDRPELIVALFAFTLLAVLGLGLWQRFSVKRSQERRGEPTGAASLDVESAEHLRDPERTHRRR